MNRSIPHWVAGLFSLAYLGGQDAPAVAQAQFVGLGSAPGALGIHSSASSVSADGATVVGAASSPWGYTRACRWTAATGMQDLGLPLSEPEDYDQSASACNSDGTYIVGSMGNYGLAIFFGFYWSAATGAILIPDSPSGSGASGVDNAFTIVAGGLGSPSGHAAVWRPQSGWTTLGTAFGSASDVTPDGSLVVGTSASQAFRWTQAGGLTMLGRLPEYLYSSASAVTPDGATIVGHSGNALGGPKEAVAWRAGIGIIRLGDLPGGQLQAQANAVCADGWRIVGSGHTDAGFEAFVYETGSGMRNLRRVLIARHGMGPLLAGWLLSRADGISADGTVIVGTGYSPSAPAPSSEAWRAVLPRCPGDYNRDGVVSPADVTAFVTAWFQSLMDGNDWGDFDLDGVVTPADVAGFVKAWWVLVTTGSC